MTKEKKWIDCFCNRWTLNIKECKAGVNKIPGFTMSLGGAVPFFF